MSKTVRDLADEVWGDGNWVLCEECLDSEGKPSLHHVNFHDTSGTPRIDDE